MMETIEDKIIKKLLKIQGIVLFLTGNIEKNFNQRFFPGFIKEKKDRYNFLEDEAHQCGFVYALIVFLSEIKTEERDEVFDLLIKKLELIWRDYIYSRQGKAPLDKFCVEADLQWILKKVNIQIP